MKEQITILILEDEPDECSMFQQYVNSLEHVSIVGCTASSSEALALAQQTLPDAVIVDLELHNGSGNGLQFLAAVKQLALSPSPYLLVTTNNSSQTTHEAARSLGADFILTKYEADYSAQYVIDFLTMMLGTLKPAHPNTMTSTHTEQTKFTSKQSRPAAPLPAEFDVLEFIQNELNIIGISPKAVGYRYLADAILIKSLNPQANLFTILGPRYKKSDPSIERAMQYAINCTWRLNDIDELLLIYTARIRSDRGVPTIMEFIYFYSTKTRTHFKIQ